MDKVKKKFIIYAEFGVFVLLTVLLAVINVINFTMATEDADRMTEAISKSPATFFNNGIKPENSGNNPSGKNNRFGSASPDSPEMHASVRQFTYAFDKDGNGEKIEYRISAFTEEEAENLAKSLLNENETGWTNVVYRYRIYEKNDKTYVTVIDQSRELVPSYRILIISVIGEVVFLLLSFLVLSYAGRILYQQFEKADRKQKRFIAKVESGFKMPLTVINANTEIIERESGVNPQTQMIDRQVRKMAKLLKDLSTLSIFEEKDMTVSKVDLSNIVSVALDSRKSEFEDKKLKLSSEIEPDIKVDGDEQAIKKAVDELIENALRFSSSDVSFTLKNENNRTVLIQTNDTQLSNGSIDQIFDRFTTLENAKEKGGAGIGLSYVKDVVKAHNGRISAKVSNKVFILKIDL